MKKYGKHISEIDVYYSICNNIIRKRSPILLLVNNPTVNRMLSRNTRAAINSHTFGTIFTVKLGRNTP